MKYLALKKDYCSEWLFEDDYCNQGIYENSVLVYPQRWRKPIEENYNTVKNAFFAIAYDRIMNENSAYSADEYAFKINYFIYGIDRITSGQIDKIVELIDKCYEDDDFYFAFGRMVFNCETEEEQEIICEFLNYLLPGSLWESYRICGCCQGDYADILINTKCTDDLKHRIDTIEAEFFRTGNAYEIFSVDDTELENNITSIIDNDEYFESYEICIPYSNDEIGSIAEEICCNPDDILMIEKQTITTHRYSICD